MECILRFSEPDKEYEAINETGKKIIINTRNQELSFLQYIHNVADVKDKIEYRRYLDTSGKYANIDKEQEVILLQEEKDWLDKGFDKALPNKQAWWLKIQKFINQLIEPEEYIKPVTENVENGTNE